MFYPSYFLSCLILTVLHLYLDIFCPFIVLPLLTSTFYPDIVDREEQSIAVLEVFLGSWYLKQQ